MENNDRIYFRLVSGEEEKIVLLSQMMFNQELEIKKIANLYYAEVFIDCKNYEYSPISIPRHLLYHDTFLILIHPNYSKTETKIYSNGGIINSYHSYDKFFKKNKKHVSLFDGCLNDLQTNLDKKTKDALKEINNTVLLDSIVKEYYKNFYIKRNYDADRKLRDVLEKNYQYLKLYKKLDFKTFKCLVKK